LDLRLPRPGLFGSPQCRKVFRALDPGGVDQQQRLDAVAVFFRQPEISNGLAGLLEENRLVWDSARSRSYTRADVVCEFAVLMVGLPPF
jgi:hypothetical protein